MELEQDMVTIKDGPYHNLPIINDADGTEFADHPFFEASSIRKINGKYYFIYSSTWMHELCWQSPIAQWAIIISEAFWFPIPTLASMAIQKRSITAVIHTGVSPL